MLKNNFLKFNSSVKQQVSGTAIGTECAPTYACIFIDEVETEFLKTRENTPLVLFIYTDILFIWAHGKEHLETFVQKVNNFNPDLKFSNESHEKEISFLDLKVKLHEGKNSTYPCIKSTDRHQYLNFTSSHPNHRGQVVLKIGLLEAYVGDEGMVS